MNSQQEKGMFISIAFHLCFGPLTNYYNICTKTHWFGVKAHYGDPIWKSH
jgi:hypothetical protein